MRSILFAAALVVLGSTLAMGQTTNQQDSPAPNPTAGVYSGNTPANTPGSDGTLLTAPAATSRSTDTPREHNWGWIGILGLAGLAGLRSRSREGYANTSNAGRRAVA